MRLLALSQVKDEADIVEVFVRHALHLFDALLVIDNGSTDGTRQILSELELEGLPLTIFDDPRPARAQGESMTRLLHEALAEHDVDFVALLDADEFMGATSRAHLEATLASVPANHCALLPWKTHVLRPEDVAGPSNPLLQMRWRRRHERPQFDKVIVPAKAAWIDDVIIEEGNHALKGRTGQGFPAVRLDGMTIRHFPVRSIDQLRSKVLCGRLAYVLHELGDGVQDDETGWHLRSIYELILRQALTSEDLTRISVNYAQDRGLLEPLEPEELVEDPIEFTVAAQLPVPPRDPLRALGRQADAVVQAAREAAQERMALRRALEQATEDRSLDTQRISELEGEVDQLRDLLDEVLSSTSWRMMALPRWLSRHGRRRA